VTTLDPKVVQLARYLLLKGYPTILQQMLEDMSHGTPDTLEAAVKGYPAICIAVAQRFIHATASPKEQDHAKS
jgi:hypothetical protein